MRIASVAKLRALLVISCLLVGVASLGFWFQPPVSVGQEPGSDLPANWQSLNASDFADLTEELYAFGRSPSRFPSVADHACLEHLSGDGRCCLGTR